MSPDYSRYKYLDIQRSNGIATLTLNQADNRNAVHAEMHGELEHVWRDLGSDPEVNVIVFTGAGKTFSAGGDIKRMAARFGTDEGWDYSLGIPAATHRMFEGILDVKQPIIAAVNGDAVGLGATLALFADISVIADTAKFGDSHVKVGLVAGDGGAIIWPQLIGFARAKELLMTGDLLSATEAAAMGLINYAVPTGELDAKVAEIAGKILGNPRWAVRWTKMTANITLKQIVVSTSDAAVAYESLSNMTADRKEAVAAFRERRPMNLTGE